MHWNFDNSYARLPELFYAKLSPVTVKSPSLVLFNHPLAEYLDLLRDGYDHQTIAAVLAGNELPNGAEPLAQAYAGHQFGHFTMLGDGRAILLGEHINSSGKRFDIQLKGSGRTPFSRNGDGKAALGPMLREYIISEAMHALRIPTTRSLAVVTTGETITRDTLLPGAILTRVASSHIRVGTFEYLAARHHPDMTHILADYTLQRHYPELVPSELPYLALLDAAIARHAKLVAQWLHVGFIHGVMNTDNMAISGETLDYGPCAFMDTYDPNTVFSSIDAHGRYAYANQANMAQWNLACYAETLLPILHDNKDEALYLATTAVKSFPNQLQQHWLDGMRLKLGLLNAEATDTTLINELLHRMQQTRADYTNSFRALATANVSANAAAILQNDGLLAWFYHWQQRLSRQAMPKQEVTDLMNAHNPAVIPRNHRVEAALDALTIHGDATLLQRLLQVLSKPYAVAPEDVDYCAPPAFCAEAYQTFCGT